jgi:hypothetical protein
MAATYDDVSRWYDEGVARAAAHLLIVHDSSTGEHFPVFVPPGTSTTEIARAYNLEPDRQVVEIYDLSVDKEQQMAECQTWHPGTAVAAGT